MVGAMTGPVIAVLHSLVPSSRQTTIDHVLCYLRYLTDARILYHHVRQPPGRLQDFGSLDLVVINYCFLAHRTTDDWGHFRETYGFLGELDCPVVALPQDDFNASALLDDWLVELGVTEIWSPIEENLEILYPRATRTTPFRRQLTGYVDDRRAAELTARATPISERPIDVGTRVRFSPPSLGRYAQLKGRQATALRDRLPERFRVDISTEPADALLGERWFDFLAACRFTVGRKGGASIHDPDNGIGRRTRKFLAENPDAAFDEVEAACFPGLDGRHVFTAVSPRLFEAAATRTCQLLAPDDYLGVLQPWVHYVPLEDDLSNLDEVVEVLRDDRRAQEIADACYEELIAGERYRYSRFAESVVRSHLEGQAVSRPAERLVDPVTDALMQLPGRFGLEALEVVRQILKVTRRRGALDAFRHAVELGRENHARGLELGGERMVVETPALAEVGPIGPVAGELATVAASLGASDAVLAWIDAAARDQLDFRESLRWTDPSVFHAPDERWRTRIMGG